MSRTTKITIEADDPKAGFTVGELMEALEDYEDLTDARMKAVVTLSGKIKSITVESEDDEVRRPVKDTPQA